MATLRRKVVVVLIAVVAVCLIAAVLIWNALFSEKVLAEIDLPSGDRITISYQSPRDLLMALAGTGGLRYHIHSGGSEVSGWLTYEAEYDFASDVNLTYKVTGDRSVRLQARGRTGWVFSGTSAGQYEITDLSKRGPIGEVE